MKAYEANFDGLVGPTHNYAGLSYGNIASMTHKAAVANPKEAALQGLAKAKALADLGYKQGILAPQERPDTHSLRQLGFHGSDAEVLAAAFRLAPEILAACSSASSMWTANAATVSPSIDSTDGRVHFTAANLNQKLHRSIESETTSRVLRAIFRDEARFAHHAPLSPSDTMGDEGAANHTRFCREYGEPGVQLFVYGRAALDGTQTAGGTSQIPSRFPARQTLEASQAIVRLHRLRLENTVFAQQAPQAIDCGAFHNDVVSVGNQNVFFYHEAAFLHADKLLAELRRQIERACETELIPICVPNSVVPLADAVKSYLFNSQLVTMSDGATADGKSMTLVAPQECQETESVRRYLGDLLTDGNVPIKDVRHFDLRQSMRNGGGPACLRLRVVLTDLEISKTNAAIWINDENYARLKSWVEKHYRDRLAVADLADPLLLNESRTALDELTRLLNLGSVYPFQR